MVRIPLLRRIRRAGAPSDNPPTTGDRTSADRWQQRAEKRGARIVELEAALARAEEELRAVHERTQGRSRPTLTHRALSQVLPSSAARTRDKIDSAAAAAREAALLAASSGYAATLGDAGARTGGLEKVDIDGMAWWVPRDAAAPERTARMASQGFPLLAILRTRMLPLGGVMIDVGANIGRTSIPRVMLGDARMVYAAEPEPANFSCLVQNVVEHGLRGVVLPDHVAIGAARGEVRLRRSRFAGGHRVLHDPSDASKSVMVPQWPLDDWLDRLAVDRDAVTFIKVDTQGSEYGVLKGAASMLDRPNAAWQIEVDPTLLAAAGTPAIELFALICAHFSHFIDVGGVVGAQPRPTAGLGEALAYVGQAKKHTDLLLYHAPR